MPARTPLILAGIALAVFRFAYAFLPFFGILDVVVLAAAGYSFARRRPGSPWQTSFYLTGPTVLELALWLLLLGSKLSRGIGVGHLIGLVLIPLSAAIAWFIGSRRRLDGRLTTAHL